MIYIMGIVGNLYEGAREEGTLWCGFVGVVLWYSNCIYIYIYIYIMVFVAFLILLMRVVILE